MGRERGEREEERGRTREGGGEMVRERGEREEERWRRRGKRRDGGGEREEEEERWRREGGGGEEIQERGERVTERGDGTLRPCPICLHHNLIQLSRWYSRECVRACACVSLSLSLSTKFHQFNHLNVRHKFYRALRYFELQSLRISRR